MNLDAIPIVDLAPILLHRPSKSAQQSQGCEEDWEIVANEFQAALRTHGFTFIVNHNIPEIKVKKAFETSQKFFHLPKDSKNKYIFDPQKHYHGYTHKELKSNEIQQELRESFDCAGTQRVYPEEVVGFGSVLEDLEVEAKELLKILLRLLAKSLQLQDEWYFLKASKYLNDSSVPSFSTFRALCYPSIPNELSLPPETYRANEHTDYGLITLLFQDEIGGLEIKTKDGKWKQINPLQHAVVINTGDLLEFWTGGLIPATPHRVLIPEDMEKRQVDRQSIAYFVHPDDDAIITPIKSDLVHYTTDFEPITACEHARKKLALVNSKNTY